MNLKRIALFVVFFCVLTFSSAALELPPGMQKLIEHQNQLASNASLLIAFLAGLITLTSPCGFALLPMYLSFAFKNRRESVYMTSAFSLGLVVAFILFGVLAGVVGDFFNEYKLAFSVVSGALIIVFGVMLLLNRGFGGFNFQTNVGGRRTFLGMFSVGFLFSAAWTPCISPVLIGILLVGANMGNVVGSVSLLGAYALGVVLPLLIVSVFADRYDLARYVRGRTLRFSVFGRKVETHSYNLFGGVILILLGIIMIHYRGTFFFQAVMTEYVPWSMGLWSYLSEAFATSTVLSATAINVVAGVLLLGFLGGIVYVLAFRGREN